uniref:TNFR-Cys domain-containing protein n=1 Tax=Oryzias latipes TaxID=8090 RepID=A0A3P9LTC6_ORYLA
MSCPTEDSYYNNGICCDRCPAGTYVQTECDKQQKTKCDGCKHGTYTATRNHVSKCITCKKCSSKIHLKEESACTAERDTVCVCERGYHCSNPDCDHCRSVTSCSQGTGVKVLATRTNDTICQTCEKGTYSNVTDFYSPCKAHTRCEDIGRQLLTPGTKELDAVCGDLRTHCSWMLPAGLWSGLVLTLLVVAAFIFWKARRRSFRAAVRCSVPVKKLKSDPPPPVIPPELPSHCQETCPVIDCKIKILNPDDPPPISKGEDEDSSLPITSLQCDCSHSTVYCPSSFVRLHSEPQEDEWCGT